MRRIRIGIGYALSLLAALTPCQASAAHRTGRAVALGSNFGCAITARGSAVCWGENLGGQLGDGTFTDRHVPGPVVALGTVTSLALGAWHACAVERSGAVKCWGANSFGQLGDGISPEQRWMSPVPVQVAGMTAGAVQVTAGDRMSCALLQSGAVKCWGRNDYGQLGDGTTEDSLTPVDVVGLEGPATQIAAGSNYVCAVLADGGLQCWGSNDAGELGIGSTDDDPHPTPQRAPYIEKVTQIAAGGSLSCAIANGGAWCWGIGNSGQLGNGDTDSSPRPVQVSGMERGVTAISAGNFHACAVRHGRLRCWGKNVTGQLGDGGAVSSSAVPVRVSAGRGVVSVATHFVTEATMYRYGDTCAVWRNGSVKCWGYNEKGQLGDAHALIREPVAAAVKSLPPGRQFTAVGMGAEFACGLTAERSVYCWGANDVGQLGTGAPQRWSLVPARVRKVRDAVALSVGGYHACALTDGGRVKCWGRNLEGQVGAGNAKLGENQRLPVEVVNLGPGVKAIAAGGYHTCAVDAAGAVKCWGRNNMGQVGYGGTATGEPVQVNDLTAGATGLGLGNLFSCAIVKGGAKCWGENQWGQLGAGISDPSTDVPQKVVGLGADVLSIRGGYGHACAVTVTGAAKCWGLNVVGQLGNGSRDSCVSIESCPAHAMAEQVVGLERGAAAIAAGDLHSCALRADGTLLCWGINRDGQLGTGTLDDSVVPVAVRGLRRVVALGAGEASTCAVRGTRPYCWGSGEDGQLGNGLADLSPVPVTVSSFVD